VNLYARLPEVKSDVAQLGPTANVTLDPIYLRAIEAESRALDDFCNRKFHTTTATRYYDGDSGSCLYFSDYSDLLSVTTLKFDDDGDGVYETTLDTGDYWLWPDNSPNKRRIDLNPEGDHSAFPVGRRRIQVVGKWGYSDLSDPAGTLGAAITTTTATEITMTTGHTVYPGDTMIVGSEEMYVSAVEANTLTVVRGINGTTAATALINAAVSIRRYPAAIEQAIRMRVVANRWDNNQGVPMGEAPRYANDNTFARFMSLIKPYRLVIV